MACFPDGSVYQVRTLFAVPLWGLFAPLRADFYSFDLSLPLTRCVPNQAGPFVPVTLGLTHDEVSARHHSHPQPSPWFAFSDRFLLLPRLALNLLCTPTGLKFTILLPQPLE